MWKNYSDSTVFSPVKVVHTLNLINLINTSNTINTKKNTNKMMTAAKEQQLAPRRRFKAENNETASSQARK